MAHRDSQNIKKISTDQINIDSNVSYSLHLKEEAHDFLEEGSLKALVQKYSQFITFNIFLWESKVNYITSVIQVYQRSRLILDRLDVYQSSLHRLVYLP